MLRILFILLLIPSIVFPAAFLNKKEASIFEHESGLEFYLVTKKNKKNENVFQIADKIEFTLKVKNTTSDEIEMTQLTGGQFASFIIYKDDLQTAYIHANYGLLVSQSLLPIKLAAGEEIISMEIVAVEELLSELGQYKVVVQSGLLLNNDIINLPITTYFYVRK